MFNEKSRRKLFGFLDMVFWVFRKLQKKEIDSNQSGKFQVERE